MRQLNGDRYVRPPPYAFQRLGNRGFCRIVPEPHIGVGDACFG